MITFLFIVFAVWYGPLSLIIVLAFLVLHISGVCLFTRLQYDPLFFRVARMSGWYAISFWCLRIYLVFFWHINGFSFPGVCSFLSLISAVWFFFSQVIYSPFLFYCFWVGFFFFFFFFLICNVDRWKKGRREGVTIRRFSWGT